MADESTATNRILLIGWVDLELESNHRFFHVVDFLAAHYDEVCFVSTSNLYGGPPVGFVKKTLKSIQNLLFDRRREYREGNVHHIVLRKLKLPMVLQALVGGLWTYLILPRSVKRDHFVTCVHTFPHTTPMIRLLKQRGVMEQVIFDDCDFFPAHLDATGRLAAMALMRTERQAVTQADGVISVSTPLAALRREQGAKHVLVVPNGVMLEQFAAGRQKEPHPPTLIYVGLLAEAWGVDLMLRALPQVRQAIPDVQFLIVGDGDARADLEHLAGELGLDGVVTFCGRQPHNRVTSYIRKSDVGVALYEPREFVKYASPMKVREYMSAGLPVITTRVGQGEEVIEESCAGELVDRTPEAVATAAIRLLSDADLRQRYSDNGIRYTQHADWNSVLMPVLDFIQTV